MLVAVPPRGLDQAVGNDRSDPHPGDLDKQHASDDDSVYRHPRQIAPNFGLMLALLVALGAWAAVGYAIAAVVS